MQDVGNHANADHDKKKQKDERHCMQRLFYLLLQTRLKQAPKMQTGGIYTVMTAKTDRRDAGL